jgi:phospholipase C
LTANPEVWGRTVFFLTFDENDGLFDHVPPPAPPSFNSDGTCAGNATLDLRGEYFSDPQRRYLHPADEISGTVRPWGLGPRVPLYVISPWTRGGWVNSQVFDHTSIGQFLEKRFRITVPAISPWHRAVCGDLSSVFDFAKPNVAAFPELPAVNDSAGILAEVAQRPRPTPPAVPEKLFQESGLRRSRALPYELHVRARSRPHTNAFALTFHNTGQVGAVFHVYDRLHLERIPRRYTVEAGKTLTDEWAAHADNGRYDLWVYGPNGFVREFIGLLDTKLQHEPEVTLEYDVAACSIKLIAANEGRSEVTLSVRANVYYPGGPWTLRVPPGKCVVNERSLIASHQWYDFTVTGERFERRFAGRMETGKPSFSDPAV